MIAKKLSPCIVTDRVEESREFYQRYFDAAVTFDCGWYVNLRFGEEHSELQFMAPKQPGQLASNGNGLIYNFQVADVDREHERLTGLGLVPVMPLDDHPWGDRGFSVQDPNGVVLYIYSEREPSEEFRSYYR